MEQSGLHSSGPFLVEAAAFSSECDESASLRDETSQHALTAQAAPSSQLARTMWLRKTGFLLSWVALVFCALMGTAIWFRSHGGHRGSAQDVIGFLGQGVPEGVNCEVETSPDTPIGEMPHDEGGRRKKACEDKSGRFTMFEMYTDSENYYTAGFKCCLKKDKNRDPPFDPKDCTINSACKTPIGQMPEDTDKKLEKACEGTFVPFKTYAEPSHYYCAGFKCCKGSGGQAAPPPLPPTPLETTCDVEDSPDTPMGEMPHDEGDERKKACEDESGRFTSFQIYTDPENYYTAGFKCCYKVEDPDLPFDPEDCTFQSSCETPIGQMPEDTGKKEEKKCKGTFIPFETYAEPTHYYCAGFKCCAPKPPS